ncbi:hypothetical protein K503DRAFT_51472 [Rhizopogon vinicolor AM-OR11-026]|uniref:Uncharacterized protein n=1 Tax=Rhizopogon vinicolor AM-OR11-026 TaxID=1314800 RepID=A0A1B7N4P8_9AGAM|nr:hypothetical protein K503DRAFT_51472 [Rhizopogon vinicolor AM-OR11-026]
MAGYIELQQASILRKEDEEKKLTHLLRCQFKFKTSIWPRPIRILTRPSGSWACSSRWCLCLGKGRNSGAVWRGLTRSWCETVKRCVLDQSHFQMCFTCQITVRKRDFLPKLLLGFPVPDVMHYHILYCM